jgi:hypothetical protein
MISDFYKDLGDDMKKFIKLILFSRNKGHKFSGYSNFDTFLTELNEEEKKYGTIKYSIFDNSVTDK